MIFGQSPVELVEAIAFVTFWVAEAICHFILHNAAGSETISHRVRRIAQALTGPYWHLVTWVPGVLLVLDLEGWL